MWAVRFLRHPSRPGIRFFGTEDEARAYYRGLWNDGAILSQSVLSVDLKFSLSIRKPSVWRGWVVAVRAGRKAGLFRCSRKDLWDAKKFRKMVLKESAIQLPEMKQYEWDAYLEHMAGKKRKP